LEVTSIGGSGINFQAANTTWTCGIFGSFWRNGLLDPILEIHVAKVVSPISMEKLRSLCFVPSLGEHWSC